MIARKQSCLRKQTVMITGATGGLGKAFAVECATRGWDLFLTDRSGSHLKTLATGLESAYQINVAIYACDLTNNLERERMLSQIRSERLSFEMLINVAGIDFEGLFFGISNQDIQTIIRLNIESPLILIREMIKNRNPNAIFRIINVSSMAAFYPMPVKAVYAASKRFLLDFSRALNEEARSENASVTVLCPAGMPTTRSCIQSIEAQGFAGLITTKNVGGVAHQTIEAALSGKTVVIPGLINQVLQKFSSLVPDSVKIRLIGWRWVSVRRKRITQGELSTI
jgi:short-subunit dehydrogenase